MTRPSSSQDGRAGWKGCSSIASEAAHYVQVGEHPVFRGAGGGELACGCGHLLATGYKPECFLAIRIRCFRCGTITATPGPPLGYVLPREALQIT